MPRTFSPPTVHTALPRAPGVSKNPVVKERELGTRASPLAHPLALLHLLIAGPLVWVLVPRFQLFHFRPHLPSGAQPPCFFCKSLTLCQSKCVIKASSCLQLTLPWKQPLAQSLDPALSLESPSSECSLIGPRCPFLLDSSWAWQGSLTHLAGTRY